MKKTIQLGAAALVLMMTVGAGAQDKPAPAVQDKPAASPAPRPSQVPVKIQLVLSRYQGEKKLSSVPYLMWVTANENRNTSLRMGVKIPVFSGGPTAGPYNYQDVGTNIDCTVSTPPDGGYKSISPSPTRPFISRIATKASLPLPRLLPLFAPSPRRSSSSFATVRPASTRAPLTRRAGKC